MSEAKTAREQAAAMYRLADKAYAASPFEQMRVATDIMAAQLTLNLMMVKDIESLTAKVDQLEKALNEKHN